MTTRDISVEVTCNECGVIDILRGTSSDDLNARLKDRTEEHVRNRHYPGFSFTWE